jgi:translation elongation factor EF-Tu-like GTPase
MAALFVSEKTHRDVKARTKNIPDILTDYSKVHAVSEEELQSEVEVEGEETEEGEEVNPIFENQLPLNFEEASERLGKEEVAKLEKSVDDLEESKSTKVAPVPA